MVTEGAGGSVARRARRRVRIAERWLDAPNATVAAAVLKRLDDPEAPVRRQVAASIGVLPRASREEAAVSVLARFADDPIAVDAALSSIPGGEATVLDTLLADPRARADAAPAVIMLAATIVRSGEPVAVQNVFSQVADRPRGMAAIGAAARRGGRATSRAHGHATCVPIADSMNLTFHYK